MDPIPIAILGYGNAARTFHIPFVRSLPEQYELRVVLQRSRNNSAGTATQAAKDLPGVQVVSDMDGVLRALPERFGLIVITTDNVSHVSYAIQALNANKHVLIEKPVALHESDVDKLAELARAKGVVCTAYQNRRFDGDFLTLHSLLISSPKTPSPLGIPTYYESRFDRFQPISKGGWREDVDPVVGGGTLWDLGAHLVDQVVTLFGPPESIFGLVRNQRNQGPLEVDDDWFAVLSYPRMNPLPGDAFAPGTRPGGLRVVLGATSLSAHLDSEQPRFRVEGTHGSYVKRGKDPQEGQLRRGWSPRTHAERFGLYEDSDSSAVRYGRLTISQTDNSPVTATSPPKLAASDIPTLPGSYVSLYINMADAIRAAEAANCPEAATQAIDKILAIKLNEVAITTRILRLIRASAEKNQPLLYDS